ncbi:hypothetical protein [Neobacillus vireti]|uniref:hypothetical protein n=1 Tax=Neobacillus vireti TaxID=220686 RepID=UPI002FFDF6B7
MYLMFNDLVALLSDFKGVREADHFYMTVTDSAAEDQPRGLFIPLSDDSGELLDAITNGAVAAIWDKEKPVPRYTPNHFPIFFTETPLNAAGELLRFYFKKIDGDKVKDMNVTKFVFLNKKLLKENKETYDIAVMLENLSMKNTNNNDERRG